MTFNGALRLMNSTKTSSDTLAAASVFTMGDATAGPFTTTMPSSTTAGIVYEVKKIDSTANIWTLGGTFDGRTNFTVGHPNQVVRVMTTTTAGAFRILSNTHCMYTHSVANQVNMTALEVSAIGVGKGYGSLTLPAGFWSAGRRIKLILKGSYQTPMVAGTVIVRIKQGSTLLARTDVGSILAGSSTVSALYGEAVITCPSVSGTTARLVCDGFLLFQVGSSTTTVPFSTAISAAAGTLTPTSGTSGPLATVDYTLTSAGLFDVTEQWNMAVSGQGTTITSGQFSEAL